jgi:hypothetical protein
VTPFLRIKKGVFFKVASDFNDIGPAIHSISVLSSQAKKYPRESNLLILAFYDACQITGHYCSVLRLCIYNFSIFKIEQCRNTAL